MVKVGNRDISVVNARKILTQFNKMFKEEVEYGKRGKGGKGVYRMRGSDLETQLKNFTIKGDKVGHKTKKDFKYTLPASKAPAIGKGGVSMKAKTTQRGKSAPKNMKKKNKTITDMIAKAKPEPKNKKIKVKKQTKKDKKDEEEGMKGQTKKTKSKTDKGDENFTGKKGDVSKSKGKDLKKVNNYRDFVKMKGGVNKVGKGEWAKYKKKNKL